MLFLVKRGDQYIPGFIPKGAGRGGCGGSLRGPAHGAIWRLRRGCHRLELLERSSRGNRRGGGCGGKQERRFAGAGGGGHRKRGKMGVGRGGRGEKSFLTEGALPRRRRGR